MTVDNWKRIIVPNRKPFVHKQWFRPRAKFLFHKFKMIELPFSQFYATDQWNFAKFDDLKNTSHKVKDYCDFVRFDVQLVKESTIEFVNKCI